MLICNKFIQDIVLDPHEITHDIRRFNLQTDTFIIIERRELLKFVDFKIRMDIGMFNFLRDGWIEQCNVDHIIFIQDFSGNPQGFGDESNSANTSAFAVAAVMHLYRRFEDVFAGYRDGTDKSGDTASAFFFCVGSEFRHLTAQFCARS